MTFSDLLGYIIMASVLIGLILINWQASKILHEQKKNMRKNYFVNKKDT